MDHHYYSVPYRLLRRKVDVRITAATVESFHDGQRVAAHPRSHLNGGFSSPRGLDRSVILRLATCDWIRRHQVALISGATGTGKTYLATADGSYPKLTDRL